jgi:tRNA dimethylallyltransferase
MAVDPAARVDLQNSRRVLRALEVSILTGQPSSALRREWEDKTAPGFRGLILARERAELNARIAENVRSMFERGVVAEVASLEAVGRTASMAIGLREIQSLLRGETTRTECIAAVTLATCRYAKRQLTWFRNQFTFQIIDLTGLRDTHDIPRSAMEFLGAV